VLVAFVDVLRGLAMVLMPLDHTREFFTNYVGNPLDPQHTTWLLYLTRWITHLCAPIFVLLAGTSIFLQQQHKTKGELSVHLFKRGLWLVIAELTLVHLVFNFNWQWNVQILEVIWAIGISMMLMAALIHLGVRVNFVIGVCIVVGHNLSDRLTPRSFGRLGCVWHLLHVPGLIGGASMTPPIVLVAYPFLPWLGVMILGYCFGPILVQGDRNRKSLECFIGFTMLLAFVLLRWSNLYGDPVRWSHQAVWWRTVLSFMNVQKYPPSLLFLLVTLGLSALIAAGIESLEEHDAWRGAREVLQVYGRVPLFFFLLHIAFIHLLALALSAARGENWHWWITEFPHGGVLTGRPPAYGFGLPFIGCVWLVVVSLLYPACKWYAGIKRTSRNAVLSYL
jgi:uncharacterized membrane protein